MKHSLYNKIKEILVLFRVIPLTGGVGGQLLALPLMGAVGGVLTACDHPVDLLDIASESQLVIYAFPTTADEYLLNVSLSRPVAGTTGTLHIACLECTTDGRADEVTLLHTESHFGMPMAVYRVKGQHRSGDRVSISVRADAPSRGGKSLTATAETVIPAAAPMEVASIDTIPAESPKLRFLVRVPALPLTRGVGGGLTGEGYYATRLTSVKDNHTTVQWDSAYDFGPDEVYHTWNWVNYAPVSYSHLDIDPSLEPLVNHYSDLNLDPWNEYYAHMYFFTSDDVRTSSPSPSGTQGGVVLHLQTDLPGWADYVDVQFYVLSREYYLMLRHLNDQLSNELGEAGLSPTHSTYSNVSGGLGCVAGYTCSHTMAR